MDEVRRGAPLSAGTFREPKGKNHCLYQGEGKLPALFPSPVSKEKGVSMDRCQNHFVFFPVKDRGDKTKPSHKKLSPLLVVNKLPRIRNHIEKIIPHSNKLPSIYPKKFLRFCDICRAAIASLPFSHFKIVHTTANAAAQLREGLENIFPSLRCRLYHHGAYYFFRRQKGINQLVVAQDNQLPSHISLEVQERGLKFNEKKSFLYNSFIFYIESIFMQLQYCIC